MSDDSDVLIAAAATAAVVTWMGTRHRPRARRRTGAQQDWRALLRAIQAGVARTWHETPCYTFFTGLRDAFFRKR